MTEAGSLKTKSVTLAAEEEEVGAQAVEITAGRTLSPRCRPAPQIESGRDG